MMKSYLRFLSRNKTYTAIMAAGLSVSLAFVIIMSCFVWQNLSVNSHYPDQDRMYAIGCYGSVMSNMAMTRTMSEALPEIECGTTLKVSVLDEAVIDNSFFEDKWFMCVGKEFFDMFPTRFLYGSIEVLNDMGNAIVTESLANRFGGEEIIGKKIRINGEEEFIISAIINDFDDTVFSNSRIIVNLSHPMNAGLSNMNFTGFASDIVSIVKTKAGTDENMLLEKMERIYEKDIPEDSRHDHYLSLTRLDKIYTSDNNEGGHTGFKKGNDGLMTAFSIIVAFLLISAIFNYINLSTALAGRRSKESATRMLLGEDRKSIFISSLLESLGFMAVCMTIAFLLAHLFIPYVNRLLDSPIPVQMRFSQGYIYMYMLIMGITALFCGIIPALISFRFKPIEIIKGQYRHYSKRTFSKVFIILQNVIAITIIAVTLTMNGQIRHMVEMPLNANTDSLFIGRTFSSGLIKTISELPYVESFGRTQGRPGESFASYGFPINGDQNNICNLNMCECDSTAFDLFGFKVLRDYGLPGGQGAWLTESAARKLEIDLDDPIFPQDVAWAINYSAIAGIIRDVPFSSALHLDRHSGAAILVGPQDQDWADYVIKLNDPSKENIRELIRLCEEEVVRAHGRKISFITSGYYPDLIEKAYEKHQKQSKMVTIFMIIAIMLSALGQIAMSTYYATEKEKEIGIRKVFGGTVRSESIRNIFEYMIYCFIACVIAVPVSVFAAGRYLETFVYKMPQKAWIYIVAAVSAFAISLISVLWQTLRAARTNPAEALKKE